MNSGSWKTLGATGLLVVGLLAVTVSMALPTRVCVVTAGGETGSCSTDRVAMLVSTALLPLGIVGILGGGWGLRRASDDAGAYGRVVSGGVLTLVGLLVGFSFGGWVWGLLTADPWVVEGMPLYSWAVLLCLAGAGLVVAGYGGRMLVGAVRSWADRA